ncbi:MAG: 23S rRNA (adenine2503-C2)-methyltransferase [Candidatus Omnitrophota bacterium]|jgi:23S rRNA (adenine2503-C2)-methyltransferase
MKKNIIEFSLEELKEDFVKNGFEPFRAEQVFDWILNKTVFNWDDMRNLSKEFRAQLESKYNIDLGEIDQKEISKEDDSIKLLIRLADKQLVETVLIPRGKRRTVCVSSQVGCKFGCIFCASGQAGFARDLTAGEIMLQIVQAKKLSDTKEITHIVFMGMGEPFDNYEQVMESIKRINSPNGFGIGARRITVSTSGIVKQMQEFANKDVQAELSISLHGPNDEIRGQLMPINQKWPVKELIQACKDYTNQTKRIITFEYLLAKGLNESTVQARELCRLLKGLDCKVNLIPLNPIKEFPYERPTYKEIRAFQRALVHGGVKATVRFSRGNDINAACGQLRRQATQ